MTRVVRIHETGGPEVMKLEDTELPAPGINEVQLRQRAIGVNYIDIYHRTGLYKLLNYPVGLGLEAAGIVEQVGEAVKGLKPGDRVAYCGGPVGAYAEYRNIPARHLVKLPDGVSFELAAASMVKGITAHYLLTQTFSVHKGDTVLIHAAAGGVGLIACQMAKHLGAKVIGTVGSAEKAKLAHANGCDFPVLYTHEDLVDKVREYTEGRGVDVVYDSVGKTTFNNSLDCLKKYGMLVSFGQSSGAIPPFDISVLSQKGSLYLTRPSLIHHIEDEKAYAKSTKALFNMMEKNIIHMRIGGMYHLEEVKQAHIDLESRKTTGALVLTV